MCFSARTCQLQIPASKDITHLASRYVQAPPPLGQSHTAGTLHSPCGSAHTHTCPIGRETPTYIHTHAAQRGQVPWAPPSPSPLLPHSPQSPAETKREGTAWKCPPGNVCPVRKALSLRCCWPCGVACPHRYLETHHTVTIHLRNYLSNYLRNNAE